EGKVFTNQKMVEGTEAEILADLKEAGYDGFLIGEHFMKSANPGKACKLFIDHIHQYSLNSSVHKTVV
ncbi:MAG: hypothetical protein AAGK97_11825, partial [Bacteroidota bacterium]